MYFEWVSDSCNQQALTKTTSDYIDFISLASFKYSNEVPYWLLNFNTLYSNWIPFKYHTKVFTGSF